MACNERSIESFVAVHNSILEILRVRSFPSLQSPCTHVHAVANIQKAAATISVMANSRPDMLMVIAAQTLIREWSLAQFCCACGNGTSHKMDADLKQSLMSCICIQAGQPLQDMRI